MPFRGRRIESGAILETRLEGRVTDDELLDYYEATFADISANWTGHELVDGSDVTDFAITIEGYRRLVSRLAPHLPDLAGSRVAMVAPSDAVYGMFRMWEMHRSDLDYEVRVFRNRPDAESWLRLERASAGNG
jgi:hypothetical protein